MHQNNIDKEKSDTVEMFTNLIRFIERHQSDLLEMMEEKQKTSEKQAEDLIKDLEKEISELEQISNTEDHLHLIQIYPSMNCFDTASLEEDDTELVKTLEHILMCFLWLGVRYMCAEDVTLDPDTAHPYLILSDDGKQVRYGDIRQDLPDNPERFDTSPCVLGKEGVSSGCFYFKVQVTGKTEWVLGVVRESVNRKGEIELTPANGFWTLALRNGNEYKALAGPDVLLSLREKPQKIGVFVYYEEGAVVFYDVDSGSIIYLYRDQSFMNDETLHPYFSPCNDDNDKNTDPLIILPYSVNE
ncbi:erythroid membrane-associated protein [Misgurnus anguillicaudatus]|uniref:erythroid membrane-associated protein n=1 Tax=Misgurnus anguillicaudatus TaxID=75329 RepID=UPI003CCF506B